LWSAHGTRTTPARFCTDPDKPHLRTGRTKCTHPDGLCVGRRGPQVCGPRRRDGSTASPPLPQPRSRQSDARSGPVRPRGDHLLLPELPARTARRPSCAADGYYQDPARGSKPRAEGKRAFAGGCSPLRQRQASVVGRASGGSARGAGPGVWAVPGSNRRPPAAVSAPRLPHAQCLRVSSRAAIKRVGWTTSATRAGW
jgi:hypothetical protein